MKTAVLTAALFVTASAALAQPPPRELYEEQLTTISGEVLSVDLTMPGASVRVRDAESGVTWLIQGPTNNTLVRAGVVPEAPGTLTVAGYQSKDKICAPDCKMRMREMTFPDGRKVFLGTSGNTAPRS